MTKPTLARHHITAAKSDAVVVNYSMATQSDITAPGWVKKGLQGLLQMPLSLHELQTTYI